MSNRQIGGRTFALCAVLRTEFANTHTGTSALVTNDGLYAIIAREPDKYPHKTGRYRLELKKKPNRPVLLAVLLDESNGYTTDAPVPVLDASTAGTARPTRSSKTPASRRTTSQKAKLTKKGHC